ncbi:MAG: hypothetical protein N3D11_04550 [Candidatus Sumerlaeia bacterium]|nr:hypothetical protein [Candidatus Sumerlaeia bacterium]
MSSWFLMAMEAPLFGGDMLYNAIVALVLFLVGAGIYFKTGNRFGWLFIAVAAYWTYITFQELIGM